MAQVIPALATEVAKLSPNAAKSGNAFSVREQLLLASVKAYVDTLPDGSITLAELAVGIRPSHVVKHAGKHTATAGATAAITVAGVLATDVVLASFQSAGTLLYISQVVPTADTITITANDAFAGGEIISYQVIRAAV